MGRSISNLVRHYFFLAITALVTMTGCKTVNSSGKRNAALSPYTALLKRLDAPLTQEQVASFVLDLHRTSLSHRETLGILFKTYDPIHEIAIIRPIIENLAHRGTDLDRTMEQGVRVGNVDVFGLGAGDSYACNIVDHFFGSLLGTADHPETYRDYLYHLGGQLLQRSPGKSGGEGGATRDNSCWV